MERNKIGSKAYYRRKMNANEDSVNTARQSETTKLPSIVHHCQACSTNQYSNENHHVASTEVVRNNKQNQRRHFLDIKSMKGFPVWSILFLAWMNFFVVLTEGKFSCYECLYLHCESGAVCDSIKSTMLEIFFPKRHFIHFDPNDVCPENELPMNSMRWANLSKECERSDSICLASPIEVHTAVDGKKDGKQLEKEYTLMTHGYLLGCASRRILLNFPETINVRVELTGRNESGNNVGGKSTSTGSNNSNGNGSSGNQKNGDVSSGISEQKGSNGSKKQTQIVYNLTNAGNGAAQFDPTKKTYKDAYNITHVYSHLFYIDQGTKNATRCIEDNCNGKVKFRRSISSTSGITLTNNGMRASMLGFFCFIVLVMK